MGLFTKKADPITSKEKAISQQLAELQSEIKKLSSKLERPEETDSQTHGSPQPTVRSTAMPHGPRVASTTTPPRSIAPREPIFESVDQGAPQSSDTEAKDHFNDLGVRKYDIAGAWRRLQRSMRGASAHNPKLVSYLAAGSIRGLRPLRYEKRIARNRFVALTIFFLIILCALIGLFWR